jgi:hypothetical protein
MNLIAYQHPSHTIDQSHVWPASGDTATKDMLGDAIFPTT